MSEQSKDAELLPCPFCGSKDLEVHGKPGILNAHDDVGCNGCNAFTPAPTWNRRSLPVGVPDGWIAVTERMPEKGKPVQVWCDGSDSAGVAWRNDDAWYMPEPQAIGYESITHWQPLAAAPTVKESLSVAPTVKAERWKCEHCGASTGEACNANGCFANERSADEAPSLPAAGSAVEEVEVVGYRIYWPAVGMEPARARTVDTSEYESKKPVFHTCVEPVMTVAQHERIFAALSAQQSAQKSKGYEL